MLTRMLSLANLTLRETIERIFVKQVYADVPRGTMMVRGENVLMLGEIVCPRNMNYRVELILGA